MLRLLATFAFAAILSAPQTSFAVITHFEGFEDPGFAPGGNNWNDFSGATISRVTSGTGGITSSDGVAHGSLTPGGGPFTRFGGYSSIFGFGFTASLDVYIDPAAWADETGFDYSVAVSDKFGSHRRDFIFHLGKDGSDLKVNASNNTDFGFNAFKLDNENSGNNFIIGSAGWYTLEQDFRNDGGVLAVDFNLYDSSDSLLYSVTRSDASDVIATEVGGNRYGWFTYNDQNGLAIDNTTLDVAAIPEASAVLCWSAITLGSVLFYRRKKNS